MMSSETSSENNSQPQGPTKKTSRLAIDTGTSMAAKTTAILEMTLKNAAPQAAHAIAAIQE